MTNTTKQRFQRTPALPVAIAFGIGCALVFGLFVGTKISAPRCSTDWVLEYVLHSVQENVDWRLQPLTRDAVRTHSANRLTRVCSATLSFVSSTENGKVEEAFVKATYQTFRTDDGTPRVEITDVEPSEKLRAIRQLVEL